VKLVVVTPIRLLGDGLCACLCQRVDIVLDTVLADLADLRGYLSRSSADAVLVEVTRGIDFDEVRAIALAWPATALVALGLEDQRQSVIRCGRAGFRGYVDRNASVERLCRTVADARAGRFTCSAEISGDLLRALCTSGGGSDAVSHLPESLTVREGEVLQLIGHGLSNKEIASELRLSVATVKHHVHHVLHKLKLPRRAQAMRRVREEPWLATSPQWNQRKDAG
jgi:DNA-binding NarL/FixJ family response regulator